MKKRLLCVSLTILLLLSFLAFPVSAEEFPAACGENATWAFDPATGTLTVSGTGAMWEVPSTFWGNISFQWEIKKIVVEEGITTIGKHAFDSLQAVTSVQLPSTLLRIEESAFSICDAIPSIQFPDGLQYIGENAFSYNSFTTLKLPNSVTECGPNAFASSQNLKEVTLSNSLKKLNYSVFDNCPNLTNITIPASVKEIDARPFSQCFSLSSVTFLGDAPIFNEYAFYDNTLLINYPAGNETWTQDKRQNYGGTVTWKPSGDAPLGGTFGRSNKMQWKLENGTLTITGNGYMDGWENNNDRPWYPYRGLIKKAVLVGNMENIYAYAFAECTELQEVVWPSSVKIIFNGAFYKCTSLKEITLPDTITTLSNGVFSNCTSLEKVTLSKNVGTLSADLFASCKALKTLTIPASVKHVMQGVFRESGIKTIRFLGDMPTFYEMYGGQGPLVRVYNATVYYPAGNSTWTTAKMNEVLSWTPGQGNQFKAEGQAAPPAGNTTPVTPTTPPATTPAETEPEETIPETTVQETTQPMETTDATEPEETVPTEATVNTEDTVPTEATVNTEETTTPTEEVTTGDDAHIAPETKFPWGWVIAAVVLVAVAVAAPFVYKIYKKRK